MGRPYGRAAPHPDGPRSRINDIAFSPDGTRLVSVSEDGTMRIWNPVNGAAVDVIQAHDFTISHATFSPYGTLIASVSQDATLRLWSAKRDEPLSAVQAAQRFPGHRTGLCAPVQAPLFHRAGIGVAKNRRRVSGACQ